MNANLGSSPTERSSPRAFTLVDLLVVVALLGLLALVLLPAVADTRSDNKSIRCLNNHRQLALAWRTYAEDYSDYLPGNDFPWMTTVQAQNLPAGAAANWSPGSMIVAVDRTNAAHLQNPSIAQLFKYLRTTTVYKCPADKSDSVRTISMNSAVGTRWCNPPAGTQRGQVPVNGGWLPGNAYNENQTAWQTYGKFSSIVRPSPAGLFLIVDEHPDSINDPSIEQPAVAGYLVDYPGSFHDGAASVAFADGHAEMRRWEDPRTKPPITGVLNSLVAGPSPNNPDTLWLSHRTSAPR